MSLSVVTYALCKKYTNKAIEEAATELEWKQVIVDELPQVGEKQTMYFVPNDSGTYTEYLWVTDLERFEEVGSTAVVVYDDELSDTSENAVQNKVVKAAIDAKIADTFKTMTVGNVNIVAQGADQLEYVAGNNVSLTGNAQNKTIAISAIDTLYEGNEISVGSASGWNAGTLPTLGTNISADKITTWSAGTLPAATIESGHILSFSTGTAPSLVYEARQIPNVTSVGTAPTLTVTPTTVLNNIHTI